MKIPFSLATNEARTESLLLNIKTRLVPVFAAGCLFSTPVASAQDVIDWENNSGGGWSDGTNWDGDEVPDESEVAQFNNFGNTFTVFLSEDVEIWSVRSLPGANVNDGDLNLTLDFAGHDFDTVGTGSSQSNLSFLQGSRNDAVTWIFENTHGTDTSTLTFQNGFEVGRANRNSDHLLIVRGDNITMNVWTAQRFAIGPGGTEGDRPGVASYQMEVREGATVNALNSNGTGPGDLNIAWNTDSGGLGETERVLTVTGAGSTVTAGNLFFRRADGELRVRDGGFVEVFDTITHVNSEEEGSAAIDVSGADSRLSAGASVFLSDRQWTVAAREGGQIEVGSDLNLEDDGTSLLEIHGHAEVNSATESALIVNNNFNVLGSAHTDDVLRFTLTNPDISTPLISVENTLNWERSVNLEIAGDSSFRPSWVEGDEFNLIDFGSHSGSFFAGLSDGDFFTSTDGDLFRMNYNDNNWSVTYIPEPGSTALVALFGSMIYFLRRRRPESARST